MAIPLTKEEKIQNLLARSREAGLCHYLKIHPDCIQYIPKNSRKYDFIKTAITTDGYVLRLLDDDEKTLEICMIAISKNIYNLRFVPEEIKTKDFLVYAVNCDYNALRMIENQTEEMCLIAIEKSPYAIYLIKDKTENIMLRATKVKGLYKDKNMPQYYNAILAYIMENGNSLQYIRREFKTYELCKAAVCNSSYAIKYIPKIILEKYPDLKTIV
jgi:hypothetical protein